jgi:hypothetical protein
MERSKIRERSTSFNADPGFHFVPSGLPTKKEKEGSGTPANAGQNLPHANTARGSRHGVGGLRRPSAVGRARLPAFHHGSRQRDLRHPRRNSGHASWDAAACVGRRYRPCLSQSSEHLTRRS